MKQEIFEKIREILVEQLGVEPEQIEEGAVLSELGMDSLDSFEIAIAIEETFSVGVEGERMEKLKTVGDVVSLVEELSS